MEDEKHVADDYRGCIQNLFLTKCKKMVRKEQIMNTIADTHTFYFCDA